MQSNVLIVGVAALPSAPCTATGDGEMRQTPILWRYNETDQFQLQPAEVRIMTSVTVATSDP